MLGVAPGLDEDGLGASRLGVQLRLTHGSVGVSRRPLLLALPGGHASLKPAFGQCRLGAGLVRPAESLPCVPPRGTLLGAGQARRAGNGPLIVAEARGLAVGGD